MKHVHKTTSANCLLSHRSKEELWANVRQNSSQGTHEDLFSDCDMKASRSVSEAAQVDSGL